MSARVEYLRGFDLEKTTTCQRLHDWEALGSHAFAEVQ